jgi:hypothetical protein
MGRNCLFHDLIERLLFGCELIGQDKSKSHDTRVRSDLLEFPTGALPAIRAFQTDKPQMRKLRRVFFFHGRLLPVCPRHPTTIAD